MGTYLSCCSVHSLPLQFPLFIHLQSSMHHMVASPAIFITYNCISACFVQGCFIAADITWLNHHIHICSGGIETVDNIRGRHLKQYIRTLDRKSTRLNSSHVSISYAVFCLKKKKITNSRIV